MTVSVATLSKWFEDNGMVEPGSQMAHEKAMDLLGMIRDTSASKGDSRNIHDALKSLSNEEVCETLAEGRSGLINICLNLLGDFNLATVARNTNWWNAQSMWIVGRKRWDRRGAVGVQNYTDIQYRADILDSIQELRAQGYRIIAAEITEDAVPLTTYAWQEKSAVIYGEEGAGLSQEVLDLVDDIVYIPGRGSVRSLNVGTTAGVFTYDYSLKRGFI